MVSAGPYKGDVSHCGHYVLMAHITAEIEFGRSKLDALETQGCLINHKMRNPLVRL